MKKKIIVVAILLVVVLTAAVAIYLVIDHSNTKTDETNKITGVEKTVNEILDENTSADKLKKLTGIEEIKPSIILGEDSDLQSKPNDEVIKENKLENYEKMQKKYADMVEKAYLDNLNYKLKNTVSGEDGNSVQTVEIRGFYYQTFVTDWSTLSVKLLKQTGFELQNLEKDSKTQIAYYKAKVKSLEIMSTYIRDYENKSETKTFTINCKDGKPKDKGDMANLLSYLRGFAYSSMDFTNQENVKDIETRSNRYYNDAIKNKTLDEKSPLKLK